MFLISLVMGFIFTLPTIPIIITHALFIIAIIHVVTKNNKNNEAFFWSVFLVSSEVFFRMSKALLFYESIKYLVILLLLIGLFIQKKKNQLSLPFIIYLLLLLVGIAFTEVPSDVSLRQVIAFNLSGPFVLGISALYFYKTTLSYESIKLFLSFSAYPIISMVAYLYFKTPDLSDIFISTGSNFEASGGFGPNQVATILGFGIFIFTVSLIIKNRITGFLIFDITLLIYIIFRGLITFSRGGIIAAFIALLIFSFYYVRNQGKVFYLSLKYMIIISFILIGVWIYTSNITGGLIVNRYTNKNKSGVKKEDFSSGRKDIFYTELNYFYENPITGIGVGSGKYKRMEEDDDLVATTHNEIGRLLSEHGIIGLLILFFLLSIPFFRLKNIDNLTIAFVFSFYLFWLITINHSAMRIAFPGFIYGMSLINLEPKKNEDTLYR